MWGTWRCLRGERALSTALPSVDDRVEYRSSDGASVRYQRLPRLLPLPLLATRPLAEIISLFAVATGVMIVVLSRIT